MKTITKKGVCKPIGKAVAMPHWFFFPQTHRGFLHVLPFRKARVPFTIHLGWWVSMPLETPHADISPVLHNHHVPKAHFHQSLSLIKTKWNKGPKSLTHTDRHTHTHTHTHTQTHTQSPPSTDLSVCRIKHNPLHGTQNVHSVAPFYLSSLTSNSLPTYNLCDAKMDLQLCPRQALGFPPSLALPRVCLIWPVPTVHILPVLSPTSVFL